MRASARACLCVCVVCRALDHGASRVADVGDEEPPRLRVAQAALQHAADGRRAIRDGVLHRVADKLVVCRLVGAQSKQTRRGLSSELQEVRSAFNWAETRALSPQPRRGGL
eukprot:46788-Pleurochrysis_carterae.AAC.2